MVSIISYEELTWPEIQALPRDTPLLIPLGNGYKLDKVAETLGHPQQIGLLPPLPFGWKGSGMQVPSPILGKLLFNLLDSLREDGFSRVYALLPQGSDLSLGIDSLISIHAHQHPLTSTFHLPEDTERGKVVLIPIGHTEQHGYHLPVSTDSLIIEAICRGAAAAVPDAATTLPVMPYGVSTHRQAFAGTLNTGGRQFEDFWGAVIDVLVERGFDRFYLLSGHGGNCSFLMNVVKYAGERHRRIFCATSWLYLSGPQGIASLESYRHSAIGGMGHACELETSLILHLRPDLVHMDRVVDETDFITTPSYYMDWVEGGALVANPPWADDSVTGAYGAGSLADAEHGKIWLQAAINEKVAHIAEIHEQHTRREDRRKSGYGLWGQNLIK